METKLSISEGNTKVGKVHNISLPPGTSCQEGVACKNDCYAMKAWRQYPATRDAWQRNWDAWKADPDAYFGEIAQFCAEKGVQRFRWHVAGDIPDFKYYEGMCAVARCCDKTQFLAFTKNFDAALKGRPENLKIVVSMWPGDFDRIHPELTSDKDIWYRMLLSHSAIAWMVPEKPSDDEWYNNMLETVVKPESLDCSGKCDECFLCWHLDPGSSVVFHQH